MTIYLPRWLQTPYFTSFPHLFDGNGDVSGWGRKPGYRAGPLFTSPTGQRALAPQPHSDLDELHIWYKIKKTAQVQRVRLLPKLKIIRRHEFGWAYSSVLNSFISVLLLIHLRRNAWGRDAISFPFHIPPIYLQWHNKFLKPKSWVLSCSPLFFSIISVISHLFFSLFSYHNSFLGHHIVGMSNLPPSVVVDGCFGLYSLNHLSSLLWLVWKEK